MEEVRQRLGEILAAQSGQSVTFGLTDTDYFFVIGLYLNPADLEAVYPFLRDDPHRPVLGVGPRYGGVVVYPASERPEAVPGCAVYRGVWFTYVPMAFVE